MRMPCALVLLCAVTSCTSQGSEAAERLTDSAARRDSIAAVAAASMNEQQVIGLLEHVHAVDSALGTLGSAKGTSSEVKEFGRMILREHHALRKDVQELSQGLRIASSAPLVSPDAPPVEMRDHLFAADPGPVWDQAYIEYAIALHHAAMENSARALAASKSPTTRQFIKKSVPILQKHLDKAASLHKALTRAQDTTAPAP